MLCLKGVLPWFEAYERPITPDQGEQTIGAIRDLQAALQEITMPPSSVIFECLGELFDQWLNLEDARSRAARTRMALAAYLPHAQSLARRYLRQRLVVLVELRDLAAAVDLVVIAEARRPRKDLPTYLRVVKIEKE